MAPKGDGDFVLDVFGSDIEDDAPAATNASRAAEEAALGDDEAPLKRVSTPPLRSADEDDDEDAIRPKKPHTPPPATGLDESGDEYEDIIDVPSSRRRGSEPAAQAPRTNVLDGLRDEDYEDEDDDSETQRRRHRKSGKKRRNNDSDSERRRRKKIRANRDASDDDEPPRVVDDDDFIDDTGARPSTERDDDVIRTEGGLGISKDIEDDEDPDDEAPKKKKMSAFEEVMEKSKSLRRPRRRELDHAKVESQCLAFLDRMMAARDEDLKCYKRGKPALSKLRMLKEVENMTNKVTHRETLIENMLLPVIKAWLDPMPDGTLPNVRIRSTLLDILSSIRVDSEWVDKLKNSQGLGKVVHFLSRHDDYQPNRRVAEKLMEKWARPVYQSNSNFQDLLAEYERPDEGRRAPEDSIIAERRRVRESVKHFKTARERMDEFKGKNKRTGEREREQVMAAVPRPAHFLYTALAEGSAKVDEKTLREHRSQAATSRKVNRTMSKMRHLNKNRTARAAKPSVNGRF